MSTRISLFCIHLTSARSCWQFIVELNLLYITWVRSTCLAEGRCVTLFAFHDRHIVIILKSALRNPGSSHEVQDFRRSPSINTRTLREWSFICPNSVYVHFDLVNSASSVANKSIPLDLRWFRITHTIAESSFDWITSSNNTYYLHDTLWYLVRWLYLPSFSDIMYDLY